MRLPDVIVALNSLSRTGWMLRGVPSSLAESVSQHSFASALIAAEVASSAGLDPFKAAFIALVHDIGESVIGDISRSADIKEEKEAAERRAIEGLEISSLIKASAIEYSEGKTPEAQAAKVGDLVSTMLQGRYYEALGFKVSDIVTSSCKEAKDAIAKLSNGSKILETLSRNGIELNC
ncbi:Predicted hydrolase of the HD superfamily [Acidilobus saccharovorans 345-15]|uniref:5'-deoxynucleotidase n=1 Tax=Acidilobus saccharovorans (strain DSM 16705 / JCM 18335 / VKM B-2471 / 345-15) TaxID=666510 RepID=D9Q2L6_ACIS3|nr:HD domain-containing protein [Acidilobus saccharovorans]ADL19554.1 Predicted hydrolase of the HD superfamily [Acidilobus saccharovorans 345-15]